LFVNLVNKIALALGLAFLAESEVDVEVSQEEEECNFRPPSPLPVTLVGLEQWYSLFPTYDGRDVDGTLPVAYKGWPRTWSRIYRNQGELEAAIRARLAAMGLTFQRNQEAMSLLEHCTCEEYRAVVGNDEFRMQTEELPARMPDERLQVKTGTEMEIDSPPDGYERSWSELSSTIADDESVGCTLEEPEHAKPLASWERAFWESTLEEAFINESYGGELYAEERSAKRRRLGWIK
jgi:hypothetical protein